MKTLNVITGLQKAAGTSTFCGEVCNRLAACGHDVTIAVCDPSAPNTYPLDSRVKLVSIDSIARDFPYDIVHIHGLWSPILHKVSSWAHAHAVPVVWSTHGMTAPWAMRHKWWKKILAWWLYQKWDLKRAAAVHCTTELEVEWNRKLGFKNCFVAPLGTNEALTQRHRDTERLEGCRDCLKVLFVGRIYPVKGLVNLVKAAALIKQSNNPNNRTILFRIVGPDQAGHQAALMKLAEELGVADMFEWPGPKFGDELSAEYDNCDLLVLPSFTENFGGVVIDALAHGKPVIASKFTPWKVLEDEHCGWWVSNDSDSLFATFQSVIEQSNNRTILQAMGQRGHQLVLDRYTWAAVCDKMVRGYSRILK